MTANNSLFNSTHSILNYSTTNNNSNLSNNNKLNNNLNNTLNNNLNNNLNNSFKSSTAQLNRRPITLSGLSIQDRIVKIHASWNVSDPQCQFQYFFYNVVPPEQIHLYGRPNHIAQDDPRWVRAKRNNPDPTRMVPTLAIGFEDLAKRVDIQQKHARIHLSKLEEISSRLNEISRKHNLETTSRLHKLKTANVKLSGRLIGLVNKLTAISHHSTIPNTVGTSYPNTHTSSTNGFQSHSHSQLLSLRASNNTPREEEEIINRIKNLRVMLVQLGGKSKIAELWSTINQIKNFGGFFISTTSNNNQLGSSSIKSSNTLSNNLNSNLNNSNSLSHSSHHPGNFQLASQNNGAFVSLAFNDGGPAKWSITDEKEIKKVLEILSGQQKGIDHLIILLRKCRAEVSLMRQAFNLESNLKSIEW